eukprot:COSAG02_NODE_83_length_39665_cov_25.213719_22_plen_419_part_00
MAWAKGAGPTAAVHHARRRSSSGHATLPPVRFGVSSDEAPRRDVYGRKIFGEPADAAERSDPNKDALDSLRGAWRPFNHWQRRQQAEQAEMAWLSSANATPEFDLDLTSQPGPLSQDPALHPSDRANDPEAPATPEIFHQGGLGQGTRRDPRRGPRRARQARWTAGDAAPKPVPGDWHRRMEEELRKEEERAEQERADQKKAEWEAWEKQQRAAAAAEASAEAAATEWANLEAAARAAAEAARAARGRSGQQNHSNRKHTTPRTEQQAPSSSQRSKEDQFKADAERAQRQQRDNAARQAKAAAEAAAARKRQQAEQEKRVAEHESLFQKFERTHDQESSPPTITLASIPMPPISNPLCLRHGASEKEKKAALRKASLRWHPDKFTQKFGRKIAAGQSEAIHAAVTSVFQSINEQREKM